MHEKVLLDVESGPLAGRSFTFDEADIFVCGRGSDCHARLPDGDDTASRHHFVMTIQPPHVSVRDLGSLNGTFVNGRKIGGRSSTETPEEGARHTFDDVELRDGDEVRVGRTTMRVSIDQPVYCPVCGRAIEAATDRGGDDPRCAACREHGAPPGRPPTPAPRATTDGGDDPLAVLLRALAERRGFLRTTPGGEPVIPGYAIDRFITSGGMGSVYLAHRIDDGTPVAVKVLLTDREADDRARALFRREVEVQRRLVGHPHCVALLDADLEGFSSWLVMEYCPGGSVNDLMLRRGGRLPIDEAAVLVLQALDGLAFAHEQALVHRDLKPHNVLLTRPDGGVAKLSDFGLAKDFERAGMSTNTRAGDYGGNPLGMPREQVRNYRFVRPVSDVWGMAATLYNMITGAMPRDFGRGRDPINVILSDPPVPIRQRDPTIPRRLAAVIDVALSDDPDERPQTARALSEALSEVL